MDISDNTQNFGTVEAAEPSRSYPRGSFFSPQPRVWSVKQIAARLNRSPAWFYEHMPRLRQLGFPNKDSILGGWDSYAVEAWLDRRAGVSSTPNIEDQMLEAVRGNC